MRDKFLNQINIKGRVYQHELAVKTVANESSANFGKEYINGRLDIATDEDGLNIVQIFYTYVTAKTKSDAPNRTYAALKKIIDTDATWIRVGKDEALKVDAQPQLAVNDWYNAEDNLISTKRAEGGFISIVKEIDENKRNYFKQDVVIVNVAHVDANPEAGIKEDFARISAYAFNFKKEILPCEFIVRSKGGMEYFEGLNASPKEPVCTSIWGNIVSQTISVPKITESAFGGDEAAAVDSYERHVREFLVTGTSKVPYDFGDESVMTIEELTKARQDREVHLADIKKRRDEYQASKSQTAPVVASFSDDFKF